jgi:hypothetical protein
MPIKVLQRRVLAGVEHMVFTPTPQMQLFAMSLFCDHALSRRPPEEICEAIGLSKKSYDGFLRYEPWFSEWLEKRRMELGGKNKRSVLEAIGMEQALKGEFQFWKPLAIREGVISHDKIEIGATLPASLEAYKEMNVDDLKALENSVMAGLRGDAHAGEIVMAQGPEGWERASDSCGASEVQGPVVLDDELGTDGELALRGIESF